MSAYSKGSKANADMAQQMARSLLPKNKLAIVQKTSDGVEYQCVECPAKFTETRKMELHLVKHNKEYRFLCGICGTGLKRKEHLDRHTLGHQEVRPHVCSECGKGFKRKEHLNIHLSIHRGEKSQICPLCDRSFYRKDHLQKHLQTHNKQFMDDVYALNDQQVIELKQEVLDDEEDIKPDISSDMYTSTLEIEEELPETPVRCEVSGVPTAERPYACPLCEKTYKRKDHLKMHSITHTAKDKVCIECGRAFHKEEQLLSHMSTHVRADGVQDSSWESANSTLNGIPIDHSEIEITPIGDLLVPRAPKLESRPHECPICFRRFKRRQHLKVHANVHARALPPITVWCSICSQGFHTNEQFEGHRCMSNAGSEGEGNGNAEGASGRKENQPHYPPEFVDISEAENSSYLEASMSVPSEPSEESESDLPRPQRVYVCKFCAKPFRRKDHYKIHLHIHTGVKSFFCTDCGKGFYRKDHLQKHSLVHIRNKLKSRPRKKIPPLFPINLLKKKDVTPEITITAPSNAKLRVPLQIKVPYQMVTSTAGGEQRVTVTPTEDEQ